MTQRFAVDSLSVDDVLRQSLAAFPPTQNPYLPAIFAIPLVATWVTLSGFLITGGPFAAASSLTLRPDLRRLATLSLFTMFSLGSFFALLFYVQLGVYISIPARYGMALAPPALAVTAAVLAQHRGRFILAGFAIVGMTSLLVALA
jgi:hypothetical protein